MRPRPPNLHERSNVQPSRPKLHGHSSFRSGRDTVTAFRRLLSGPGHITRHCSGVAVPRDVCHGNNVAASWIIPFDCSLSSRLPRPDPASSSSSSRFDPAVKEFHRYPPPSVTIVTLLFADSLTRIGRRGDDVPLSAVELFVVRELFVD